MFIFSDVHVSSFNYNHFFLQMRLSQEGYIVNNLFVIRMQHRSKTFFINWVFGRQWFEE